MQPETHTAHTIWRRTNSTAWRCWLTIWMPQLQFDQSSSLMCPHLPDWCAVLSYSEALAFKLRAPTNRNKIILSILFHFLKISLFFKSLNNFVRFIFVWDRWRTICDEDTSGSTNIRFPKCEQIKLKTKEKSCAQKKSHKKLNNYVDLIYRCLLKKNWIQIISDIDFSKFFENFEHLFLHF